MHLITKTTVTKKKYIQRKSLNGMRKLCTNCIACIYIRKGKLIQINGKECKTFNMIFAILGKTNMCRDVYIGETRQAARPQPS